MKPIHLLSVGAELERFGDLIAAAATLDCRVGWLDLANRPPLPGPLASAVGAGALRAVALTETGAVVVKPVGGRPRLRELLREHFLGCRLVLVRGELDAAVEGAPERRLPRLVARGSGWTVEVEGRRLELSNDELAARLRRPARTFLRP